MAITKHFYKTKAKTKNLEVSYDSEADSIRIVFNHTIRSGRVFHSDYLSMHPSYIEPLIELLKEVAPSKEEQRAE